MAEKMKRKEVTEAKIRLRGEISEILESIRAVGKVPERIMRGDQVMAAQYKDLLEDAKNKAQYSYQHGSLVDLQARRFKLKGLLDAIQ